jgi:hypothetical protein
VALCHLSVAAQVINERNLVTSFATAMARLWGPSSFHADGVWWENTHDFTRSATEQGSLALGPLQEIAARLPEEARTGAVSVDALKQVAERSRLSAQATAGLRLPDGRPLTRGDTAWQPPGTNFVGFTNLTYNDSGLFSLSRGTDPSGTALYLGLSPMAAGGRYGGGHQHDDRLSLLLWTGGRDVLSDAGYPVFLKGNNRFFHTSAWAHNMTVATDTTQKPQAGWARSGLLGYDPGSGTGQQVQAILASSPGPAMDGVTVNERCLVLVGADRQRSYTLDVTWIKGGSVHESFLRSAEDEDCESRVTPALTSARGTLAEALGEAPGYLPSHRARLSLAGTGRGGQDFDVTWTGKESGLTLHSYLRGIPYETVFLSRMPRLRPTENSVETKDNFPGWHLYRRREVRPEDITCVAAVHDTARKGERGLILNVEWLRPAPADAGAVAVKVYLRDRIDTWYFSRDTIHRTVDGNSFAGRICGAAGSGARLAWGYVWGAGELQMGPLRVTGAAPVEGEVLAIGRDATTGRSFFEVASTFVPDNTLKGRWGCLMGADGVGNGYRMVSAKAAGEGKVRVEVEGEIGWGMENGLVTRSWFPLSTGTGEGRITLAAPVTFRVDRAVFQPGSP